MTPVEEPTTGNDVKRGPTVLEQALSRAWVAAQAAREAVPDSGIAETPSQRRKLDGMIGEAIDALRAARAALKAKPVAGS